MSVADALELHFTRTTGDYVAAFLLNLRHTPFALWLLVLGPLLVAIMPLILGIYEGWLHYAVSTYAWFFPFMLVLQLVMAVLQAFQASRVQGALGPMTYIFQPDGLQTQAELGVATVKWIAFRGAFESRALIIIRQRGCIHILPKRGMSEEMLAHLRGILQKHVAEPVRLRSGESK